MTLWAWLYVLIGVWMWHRWTPAAHINEHHFTPFRILLWPVILVMGIRHAIHLLRQDTPHDA